jgi:hypothetical protein
VVTTAYLITSLVDAGAPNLLTGSSRQDQNRYSRTGHSVGEVKCAGSQRAAPLQRHRQDRPPIVGALNSLAKRRAGSTVVIHFPIDLSNRCSTGQTLTSIYSRREAVRCEAARPDSDYWAGRRSGNCG